MRGWRNNPDRADLLQVRRRTYLKTQSCTYNPRASDIETAITKMLESIKKQGKRVLVTIDEVVSADTMRKIAMTETGKISDIRAFLKLNTNEFNPYRKRLIKRGIINGDVRGYVTFTLPLFEEFVKESYEG